MHGQNGAYNYGAIEEGEAGRKEPKTKCKKTLCWLIPVIVSVVVIALTVVGICFATGILPAKGQVNNQTITL